MAVPAAPTSPLIDEAVARILRDAVLRAREDPEWFAREILRVQLDPWQVEAADALADIWRAKTKVNHERKKKITIRAGHGPGKTFFAGGFAMHYFNFCWRGRMPVTAPKLKQVTDRIWPAFRKTRAGALPLYRELTKVDATRITWGGDPDWCAMAETAAEPEGLAGHHDDYMLFLVEEASGVSEEMFPVIEGALSTGVHCVLLLIGNPTRNEGTFHASHCREEVARTFYQIHASVDRAPRIDRKWLAELIAKYGEKSPVVQVRGFGNFAELDENQVIALSWLHHARMAEAPESDGSFPRLRVSVDVADGGEDETVVTVAKHWDTFSVVLKQEVFSFPAGEAPILSGEAAERAFAAWGGDGAKGDDLVVDSLGVGAGTAGYLIKRGLPVVQHRGGEQSDNPKRWRNRRVQSYLALRDALQGKRLYIAPDALQKRDVEEFDAQLCSIRYREGVDSKDDLETKLDLKRRGLKSPDRADSLAMQFTSRQPDLAGAGGGSPVVESFGGAFDGAS